MLCYIHRRILKESHFQEWQFDTKGSYTPSHQSVFKLTSAVRAQLDTKTLQHAGTTLKAFQKPLS